MLGNKLLLAIGWYIAGSVISTMFNEKKGEKVRSDIQTAKKKWTDSKKVLLASFIDTHKNFFNDLKETHLTDENKEIFSEKFTQVKSIVKSYAKEWEKLIAELKEQGGDYAEEAKQKLEDQYNEKKSLLEELKEDAPEKVEKMKEKLLTKFDEMKKKI